MSFGTSWTYYLLKCSLIIITALGLRKSISDIIRDLSSDAINYISLIISFIGALATFAGLYGAIYEIWQPLLAYSIFMIAVIYSVSGTDDHPRPDPRVISIYKIFTLIALIMVVVSYNIDPEVNSKPEVQKTGNIPIGGFLAQNWTYQALRWTLVILEIICLWVIFTAFNYNSSASKVFYGAVTTSGLCGAIWESWKLLFGYSFFIAPLEVVLVFRYLQGRDVGSSVVLNSVKLMMALGVAGYLYFYDCAFPVEMLESDGYIFRLEVHNNFSESSKV